MIQAVGIKVRMNTAVKAIEIGLIRDTNRGKKSIKVIFRPFSA
jgi:hypothetical protein